MTRSPAITDGRPVLVTGGAGFIGSNLVDRLCAAGHRVIVYDALLRPGVEHNLAWLKERHPDKIIAAIHDVRDTATLAESVTAAGAIFHLAAQVAVTTSLERPREDFEVNVQATIGLLEAVRTLGRPVPTIFASTNKVYGDLEGLEISLSDGRYQPQSPTLRAHGIDESQALDFHTPYGCSKGAADQYVLDYARSFGLPAAVLRMSCIYGPRQLGTEDQGWVAHFLIQAMAGRPVTIYGDGRQVRDILDVADAVEAYLSAWANIGSVAGKAFNLGGGPANAVCLRTLLDYVGQILNQPVEIDFDDWRAGDQRYFVANTRRARAALQLGAPRPWREGVLALARWLAEARLADARAAPALQEAVS